MDVTDYKRFQTLDAQGDWFDGNPNSFLEGAEGAEVFFTNYYPNPYAILSNVVSLNVPTNAIITGVEFNIAIVSNLLTTDQIWSGKVSLSSISEEDLTNTLLTIPPPGSVSTLKYTFGGDGELFGLNLTPENVDNIKIGFKLTQLGNTSILGAIYGEAGDSTPPLDTPSPAVRIYYTLPSLTSTSILPGPSFMSSNVDLTRFRGLGGKPSSFSAPEKSEDIFGFTSVVILQEDKNAQQATNSVFGDAANFGKLATNRGGGTGISSTTGLLDTSKAPISVRKGFRGL
jgi:hypothetical protein